MTSRLIQTFGIISFLAALAGTPDVAASQTASQVGAWDGLMLSPMGALAPMARPAGYLVDGANEFSLRYGRWSYDAEDAVHDNVGLTWKHGLGFAGTQLSLTGAYEMVECPTCSGWVIGGIDVQATAWSHALAGTRDRPTSFGVAVRASLGGAHYLGPAGTTTTSAAMTLPLDVTVPFGRTSALCATILPGFGFGRISSPDITESGVLPSIGGALSWRIDSRFTLDAGVERVIIAGGPSQIGASFSWKPE